MEIQRTNTPSTPRFDNPRLSESPGLLDYSLGLLTGAALVLLIHALHSDDTANHANQED